MATINIPPVHLPGIKVLTELSEDNMQSIYDFLKSLPAPLGITQFISRFSESLGGSHYEQVADAIYSFGQLLSYKDYDVREIAQNLTESYQELAEVELPDYESKILEERLFNILSNASFLIITNQAYSLFYDLNTLTKSSISQDIRLLYKHDDYKTKNVILLHKLLINFRCKGKTESHVFYLDNNDLRDLKFQIEDSLSNEESIRNDNEGILNFIELS